MSNENTTIKPTRTFVGAEGEYSRDTAGPEAIKADIDAINRMFDPAAPNGGIGKGNLNFSFSDDDIRDEIKVEGEDGTDVTLQESLTAVYADIADRYTKEEIDTTLAELEASVVKNVVIDNAARNISITIDETTTTYNLDNLYLVTASSTPEQVRAATQSGKCPILKYAVTMPNNETAVVLLPYIGPNSINHIFGGYWYSNTYGTFYATVSFSAGGFVEYLKFMDELVPTDNAPTENSTKFITSGKLYDILDDLDTRLDTDEATLAGKQNTLTFDDTPTANSNNPVKSSGIKAALDTKQNTLTFDNVPTANSDNPVKSGGVKTALDTKQDTLTFDDVPTDGSNRPVKSNGIYDALATKQDILTFDSTPTASSTNPVTSGGVKAALDTKQDLLTIDSAPTSGGTNPISSGGVFTALQGKQNTLTFDSTPTSGSSNPVTSNGIYEAIQAGGGGGGGGGSVFICTSGTTAADIKAAIVAGKYVIYKKSGTNDEYYPLVAADTDSDFYVFGSADMYSGKFPSAILQNGTWTEKSITIDSNSLTTNADRIPNSRVVSAALDGKQNTLTFDSAPTSGSDNPVKSGGVYTALSGKQDTLTFDNAPTASSDNPVKSGGIYTAIQDASARTTTTTLLAASWSGNSAPFSYDLGNAYDGFAVAIAPANTATDDQIKDWEKAGIYGSASTTMYARNSKPTENLPVVITYWKIKEV